MPSDKDNDAAQVPEEQRPETPANPDNVSSLPSTADEDAGTDPVDGDATTAAPASAPDTDDRPGDSAPQKGSETGGGSDEQA